MPVKHQGRFQLQLVPARETAPAARKGRDDPMPRTSAFGYGFESKQILEIGEASFKDGCRPRVAHSKIK